MLISVDCDKKEIKMMLTNQEKYEVYRALKVDLKKALATGFYFEAVMIEYAIIENRLSSIIDHGGVWKNPYNENKTITAKIKAIKTQVEQKHPILSAKLKSEPELFDEIVIWKDERNTFVHRACTHGYDKDELKKLAEDGKILVDKICNGADRVKKASEKSSK